MNINDFKTSKFLKKEEVGEGKILTISAISQENVSAEGAEPEMKICLHFQEIDKPLVCNSTNAQIIAQFTGVQDNIEHGWIGKQVVLYHEPNISFGGKLVGGIRVRAPKNQVAKPDLPF